MKGHNIVKVEINKIEKRKTVERTNKPKTLLFRKINKISKF